jgi:hypothetical protein
VKDKLDLIGKGTILTDLIRVPGSDIGGWKELPQRKNKQSRAQKTKSSADLLKFGPNSNTGPP